MINLLLQDFAGAQCLKHRVLGIAHLVFSPYLCAQLETGRDSGGTSTWGAGELQDDWYDGLKTLQGADLSGKTIALFGCGDCSTYSDTFVGGMGELYNGIRDSGAKFIGSVETDGYTFDDSEAVIDGKFIGLPLDDINEDDKTDTRIEAWLTAITPSL